MVIQKEIYLYEVNKKVMNIQLVKQIEWAETQNLNKLKLCSYFY